MRWRSLALALSLATLLGGCVEDDSDKARAYREYLRVELDGKNCCRLSEQQSLEHLERAIALDPVSATYRRARAGFLERLGRRGDALLELDRVIALEDSRYVRSQRGWVRCDLRQFDAAVEDFDRALAADPSDRTFLAGRALALVAAGRPGMADADAELLVRDHSSERDSHFVRSAVFLAQDQMTDAFAAIERALAVDKDAPHLYLLRARLEERVGNRIGALADRTTARLRGGSTVMRPCLDPFAADAGERSLAVSGLQAVPVELPREVAGEVRWPHLLLVESTSIDRSQVDLAIAAAPAPPASAPDRLMLVDASGARAGRLVIERRSCRSPCGFSGGAVCHPYGEYAHDRGALAIPALASTDPDVSVHPISPAWRTGLQRQLADATAWPDAEPVGAVAAGYSIRVEGRSYAVLMSRFGDETYPGLWAWQGGRWHHRLLVPSYPTVCERR